MSNTPAAHHTRMAGQIISSLGMGVGNQDCVSRILKKIDAPDKGYIAIQGCTTMIKTSFADAKSGKQQQTLNKFFRDSNTGRAVSATIGTFLNRLGGKDTKKEEVHTVFIDTVKALSKLTGQSDQKTLEALKPSVTEIGDLKSFFTGLLGVYKDSKTQSKPGIPSLPWVGRPAPSGVGKIL